MSTMRWRGAWLSITSVLLACGGARPALRGTLVDLTYSFDDKTLYWPTSPTGFVHTQLSWGMTPSGYFYAAAAIAAPEHGGTHLDAPIHFGEGKPTADKIPLERLVGPAVVIDMRAAADKDRDALLRADDVRAWEMDNGPLAAGTIVLVRTGWADRWPDRERYFGGNTADTLHFPGVGDDAARLLVERKVAAVGIDTASIDHGPSHDFRTHRVLADAETPIFENVASLARLPARGAWIVALPMKIGGGTGGPLRIVAVLPE